MKLVQVWPIDDKDPVYVNPEQVVSIINYPRGGNKTGCCLRMASGWSVCIPLSQDQAASLLKVEVDKSWGGYVPAE